MSADEAFIQAIEQNPDDQNPYLVYADWLEERGDPRGEFIRIQCALEDEKRPAKERKAMQKREKELLDKHELDWLGVDLDKPLQKRAGLFYAFVRGWLGRLSISELGIGDARALAKSPGTRLLRHLVVETTAYEEEGEYEPGPDVPTEVESAALHALARSDYLTRLTYLRIGEEPDTSGYYNCHTGGEAAVDMVRKCPRLEELHLLAHRVDTGELFALRSLDNLRVLRVYHTDNYALEILARNRSLTRLTELLLHPHAMEYDAEGAYINLSGVQAIVHSPLLKNLTRLQLHLSDMGDAGCEEIVRSGILGRLKILDLAHGAITDEGARILASSPQLPNLELLDVSRNALMRQGVRVLKRVVKNLRADEQHNESDTDYLYEGDIE